MKITKQATWLKGLVVCALVCSFALAATAQDYYPTTIGNTWVFLSSDGAEKRTYSIGEVEGEDLISLNIVTETLGTDAVDNDVYYISDDNGDLLLHRTRLEEGAFGIAAAILEPPALFFPADLPLGRTWDLVTVTELKIVGTATTTSTITVVDVETVETPTGTFENCVKLEIKRKIVTAIQTLVPVYYQWLAPDVGPVKYENDQGIVFELQSYNLISDAETPEETDETTVDTPEETETTEETEVETPTDTETTEETEVETPTDTETTEETEVETPTDTETTEETEVETPTDTETTEETTEPITPSQFNIKLDLGLNLISVPLMPAEPHTAKSLAEFLVSTIVIKLDRETQEFVGYSVVHQGDGFDIDGSSGYIVNTPAGGNFTFTGTAWQHNSDDASAAPKISMNKSAWGFVITSKLQDLADGTSYTLTAKNLRTGAVKTKKVNTEDKTVSVAWADTSRKSVIQTDDEIEIALLDENGNVLSGPFQRTVTSTDIHNAFLSIQMRVGDVRPKKTILAQNFPNPFNPETWIPYQLSQDANVTIQIYNVSGHAIRTLNLGHKSIGSYMTASTAAYWDGKNSIGETVSSGIYFYTLKTKDFSATRRMIILK